MMKKILFTCTALLCGSQSNISFAQSPSGSQNYVMETTVKSRGHKTVSGLSGLPVDSLNRNIRYFDGLGRPLQTVDWQASPLKKDLVQVFEYDAFGREVKKDLPYAEQNSSDASFKASGATNQLSYYGVTGWDGAVVKTPNPYALKVFEASPLNRVVEQGAAGAPWQPAVGGSTGHTMKMEYATNVADEVKLWTVNSAQDGATSGAYLPGKLYKTISKDENWVSGKGSTMEEFKDMAGRVVLKRVWETDAKSLSTYYVYDDFGNLRYVLPPAVTVSSFAETDAVFENFIYAYRYDGRKRLVQKKIPGKGWEYIVYNKLDQLVLSQDANQHAAGKWLFTKYDVFGRPVVTGIVASAKTRAEWQADIDAQSGNLWENRDDADASTSGTGYTNNTLPSAVISNCLTFNYYDDYTFYNNTIGNPSGSLEVNGGRTKGLPTGTKVNILGTSTFLLTVNYYDADGRVIRTKGDNHLNGTDEVLNTYSFVGELLTSKRTHSAVIAGVSKGAEVKNEYVYDHMGRKTGTRENIDNQGWVTLNKLEYNEIGQLKTKNLHSTDGTNFLQHTGFAYNERGWLKNSTSAEFKMQLDYEDGTVPQYNGNISSQRWGSTLNNVFTYSYDRLNRLTGGTSTGIVMNEALSYDVMGNITSMSRSDGTAAKTGTYNYTGNRLNNISGGLLATGNYAYDANGNAVTDGRNGISLTYNVLNLPETAVRTSGTPVNIAYAYSAGGEKLKKTSGTTVTDYVGGIQYENGSIDFIQTEEGMAKRIGTDYVYQYNLTDHLGNVRVTFNRNPSTGLVQKLQEDNYYAFGLRRVASAGTNKYLYNGKELQEELEQYDYGARFYDPVIGRWNSVDPHTERYESITPYSYAFNNPARFIDVKGKDPGDVVVVFGGADLFSKKDKGGAPLIVQQLQDKYFKQKGGIAESYSSDFWGNGALAKDHLDEATQSAYDLILANHNKDGGKEVKDGQVIIEGYSYGGVLANHLAKRLKEADVKVNLLVTVDAAAGPGSPFVDREISSNVEKNVNYYQTKPSSIRSRGDKNRREKDNTTTEIINLDVTKFVDGHGNIDDKLLMNVVNRILNQLK